MRSSLRFSIPLLGAAALLAGLLVTGGCSSTRPNQDPTGMPFPAVVGNSLEEEPVALPADLAGRPAILLVGYKQRAQFDLDRWVMGLMAADVAVPIFEVPTIPSLVPSMISGWIDDGMRSGIPQEDWGAVVTLYGSAAEPVAAFTGTERGNLGRALLLDAEGQVVWFDDGGFSPRKVLELAERARSLEQGR